MAVTWLMVVTILAHPQPAAAFGTVRGFGQDAEHERITRHALSCALAAAVVQDCFEAFSIDQFAGRRGSFGAVGAPDNPARGLLFTSAAHCDNGDYLDVAGYGQSRQQANAMLLSCRAFMQDHMDAAVAAAADLLGPDGSIDDSQIPTLIGCTFMGKPGRAKCNVLEELGLAMHAAEDFYSHTNWVDRPDPRQPVSLTNPPGLGNAAPSPWLDLRVVDPPVPDGLISGCFAGVPEALFCNDGPGRVKHEILNKDEGQVDPVMGSGRTSRGEVDGNFARAATAAIADARDKWATFEERLTARYGERRAATMICALTHDDPASCPAPGGSG